MKEDSFIIYLVTKKNIRVDEVIGKKLLTLIRDVLLHEAFFITIHDGPVAELFAVIIVSRDSIVHLCLKQPVI